MKHPTKSKTSEKRARRAVSRSSRIILFGITLSLLFTTQLTVSAAPDKTTSSVNSQAQSYTEDSPADYLSEMGRKIKKSWDPSDDEARQQTMVGFTISQDGSISELKILRSSKNEAYDKRALQAVMEASPFDRLPESTEKIEVQFSFDNRKSSHAPPTRAEIGVTESDLIWLPSLAR
jgi:TonB family protein